MLQSGRERYVFGECVWWLDTERFWQQDEFQSYWQLLPCRTSLSVHHRRYFEEIRAWEVNQQSS